MPFWDREWGSCEKASPHESFQETLMHCLMINVPGNIFYQANKAAAAIRKDWIIVIKGKKQAMASGGPASHMIKATDPSGKSMPEVEITNKIMGLRHAVATTTAFLIKYVGLIPKYMKKL
ncbi:Beta-amyrin 28-monooxygenase [Sesamum alatum]|uniref:Beta-amyrin 28-monooxygenase n=1 Tax=Sesamum alatum TaxID=300844 RepID=A0AAE1XIJ6_9LAMI|nr:Beta-amyrin 28-monooxygenase [Sesamum alatum]